jgi:hypothetical protein
MKYLIFFGSIFFAQLSFADTLKVAAPILFQDIQNIKLGTDTKRDLETRFGKADSEFSVSETDFAMVYNRPFESGRSYQKASFVLSKKSNVVFTALWIPDEKDPLKIAINAKRYFKSAHFTSTPRGWVGHHEYIDDLTLNDEALGVSIELYHSNQKVTSIAFDLPVKRVPAKQDKI